MPPKNKIFLGKGALPPYNPRQGLAPLTPANTLPRHLAHRLSFPCTSVRKDLKTVGGNEPLGGIKIGGRMESLVEIVYKWRIHCEIYPLKRVFLGF